MGRLMRVVGMVALYGVALVGVPLAVGFGNLWGKYRAIPEPAVPRGLEAAAERNPEHDPEKMTAVFMAGAYGTEISDILPPFQLLGETGAFNLYVVGPEREPLPMRSGLRTYAGVNVIPHYSFAGYDEQFDEAPDLLVVPYIPQFDEGRNAELVPWMREHVGPETRVLTICAGAEAFAATGLFDGGRATSHQNWIEPLAERHPDVEWVKSARFVETGRMMSSAAVASGFDATLATIEIMLGREAAERVAERVHYRHLKYLDEQAFEPNALDLEGLWLGAYRFGGETVGLYLGDGVSELGVAALLDLYPLMFSGRAVTLGDGSWATRSRHGMLLAPHTTLDLAGPVDVVYMFASGGGVPPDLEAWAARRNETVRVLPNPAGAGVFAYDAVLKVFSGDYGQSVARAAGRNLMYPVEGLELEGPARPVGAMATAGLMGLAAVGLVHGVRVRRRRVHAGGAAESAAAAA